jgi:nicotinic acid mononucleotide adenylyltransferase
MLENIDKMVAFVQDDFEQLAQKNNFEAGSSLLLAKSKELILNALLSIRNKVAAKTIDPSVYVMTSPACNVEESVVPSTTILGEIRIGVIAITGNPVHWGHIYGSLRSLELYNFDTCVFLCPGEAPSKPDKESKEHRHAMLKLALERFNPLLRYSSIGYDNDRPGRENFFELVRLNSHLKARFYYVCGSEWKEKIILDFSSLAQTFLARSRANCESNISLGIAFMKREGTDVIFRDLTALTTIEILDRDQGDELQISSTQIRDCKTFYLCPIPVMEYILKNSLYAEQVSRRNP